jgi:hypothetical protein
MSMSIACTTTPRRSFSLPGTHSFPFLTFSFNIPFSTHDFYSARFSLKILATFLCTPFLSFISEFFFVASERSIMDTRIRACYMGGKRRA